MTELGRRLDIVWKCVARGEDQRLRWEIRRILVSNDYKLSGAYSQPDDVISSQLPKCLREFEKLRLAPSAAFWRSMHSLKMRGASDNEVLGAEQEFWLSSDGLIVVLLFMMAHRRGIDKRDLSRACLEAFLASCVEADAFRALPWGTPSLASLQLCGEGMNASGWCCHAAEVVPHMQGPMNHGVALAFLSSLQKKAKCPFCGIPPWVSGSANFKGDRRWGSMLGSAGLLAHEQVYFAWARGL